jgi:hypothetical protein
VKEITVAQQYGVSFLPLMTMEKQGLVEKHAVAAGLAGLNAKSGRRALVNRIRARVTPICLLRQCLAAGRYKPRSQSYRP